MHSKLKRLLVAAALTVTAITGSLVAGPAAQAAQAAPAEPTLVPREVSAQALQDATAANEPPIDAVGYNVYYGDSILRGYIEIYVYSDHRKRLVVCDTRGDYREPTLQVDPSHAEPLVYQDPNGSHAGCLAHDIWYPVRKFRIGFHEEGNATVALWWWAWFNTPPEGPLPYPDF